MTSSPSRPRAPHSHTGNPNRAAGAGTARPLRVLLLVLALVATSCGTSSQAADTPPDSIPLSEEEEQARVVGGGTAEQDTDPSEDTVVEIPDGVDPSTLPAAVNAALGRGVNLGNALDGPRETTWGPGLEAEYFQLIKEAGFDHVRLPVSWAGYADPNPPYLIPDDDATIDSDEYSSIWERVNWAIDQAEANDLMIIVNMHHYDELHADLDAEAPRFLAIWEQVSQRLADAGDHVVLEILNEPHGDFNASASLWNDLFVETLAIVREDHPTRTVIVGPSNFNAVTSLEDLELPADPYLLGTVHVYAPFNFTHQGAVFADPIPPVGVGWNPDHIGLAEIVDNGSWETEVNAGPDGATVEYTAQWAGLAVWLEDAFTPTSLSVTATGQTGLRAGCRTNSDLIEITEIQISGTSTYDIDISTCPDNSTGVFLMNTSESPQTITVNAFELCTADGCQDLLSTQRQALVDHFAIAAEWSDRTGIPLNLGEFGAFGANGQSPLADRAAWTATVVEIAEGHGMSTSYWEFYSGFGIFDVETQTFVPELLDALVG